MLNNPLLQILLLTMLAATSAGAQPVGLTAERLKRLAETCVGEITAQAKVQEPTGTINLTGYPVTDTDRSTWGGFMPSAMVNQNLHVLPMVTSTVLDGGSPCAAWKTCLDAKVRRLRANR